MHKPKMHMSIALRLAALVAACCAVCVLGAPAPLFVQPTPGYVLMLRADTDTLSFRGLGTMPQIQYEKSNIAPARERVMLAGDAIVACTLKVDYPNPQWECTCEDTTVEFLRAEVSCEGQTGPDDWRSDSRTCAVYLDAVRARNRYAPASNAPMSDGQRWPPQAAPTETVTETTSTTTTTTEPLYAAARPVSTGEWICLAVVLFIFVGFVTWMCCDDHRSQRTQWSTQQQTERDHRRAHRFGTPASPAQPVYNSYSETNVHHAAPAPPAFAPSYSAYAPMHSAGYSSVYTPVYSSPTYVVPAHTEPTRQTRTTHTVTRTSTTPSDAPPPYSASHADSYSAPSSSSSSAAPKARVVAGQRNR